jgi:hypothetical protein
MTTLKWYTLLNKSEKGSRSRSLMECVDLDARAFVVCQQLEHRYFCKFNTYLAYAMYARKAVAKTHQCFYEVIFGKKPQKPYFDIDIMIGVTSNGVTLTVPDAIELKNQVISSILSTFDYIIPSDILVFTSHSNAKYSYHIVVDNWCVEDHEENKIFCMKVRENVNTHLALFIDDLVYKSIQQLRIYQCHKYQSDRVKILDKECKWKPKTKIRSSDHEYALILGGSLVGNTSYCSITPSLKPPLEIRKKYEGPDTVLDDGDDIKCLDMLAELGEVGTHKNVMFPYSVKEVKGSLILLNRHRPSYCTLCSRVHENEHPYLMVVGKNRSVYFNCRRAAPTEKLHLGELGASIYVDAILDDKHIEQIVPEQVPDLLSNTCPTLQSIMKPSGQTCMLPIPDIDGVCEVGSKLINFPNSLNEPSSKVSESCNLEVSTSRLPFEKITNDSDDWFSKALVNVKSVSQVRNAYYTPFTKVDIKAVRPPKATIIPSFSIYI